MANINQNAMTFGQTTVHVLTDSNTAPASGNSIGTVCDIGDLDNETNMAMYRDYATSRERPIPTHRTAQELDITIPWSPGFAQFSALATKFTNGGTVWVALVAVDPFTPANKTKLVFQAFVKKMTDNWSAKEDRATRTLTFVFDGDALLTAV